MNQPFNPMPPYPPDGIPYYWLNEQSGQLPTAINAYLHCRGGGELPTDKQIFFIRCYLEHWVNAPCWAEDDIGTLAKLRQTAPQIKTVADIDKWLDLALEIALDPL